MATRYKGFSTVGQTKKFHLTDLELVKRDLMNHFSIRKGEKLMNPNFGTIIWNVLFDPLTKDLRSLIVDDVTKIVNYDPRLRADKVSVDQFDQGLLLEVDMTFLPGNFSDKLKLEFNSDSNRLIVL